MHIVEKYIFVDDRGVEHPLEVTISRSIEHLGKPDTFFIEEEIRRIRDRELKAELDAKGFLKPWWQFW